MDNTTTGKQRSMKKQGVGRDGKCIVPLRTATRNIKSRTKRKRLKFFFNKQDCYFLEEDERLSKGILSFCTFSIRKRNSLLNDLACSPYLSQGTENLILRPLLMLLGPNPRKV